ncbi:P-loop containing nucleoside triphosphate hydrolase protein [Suillus clintonianus]|uniref:P-loop containing nucleoside triphosphate hydrolase protein n=1 Tax=Suillus clintonianus TaxID=1904413 RepID=UPI001B865D2F|nr:P-loop containing nucleoside triphosphate hydrolase protein [Suillus clintonianus]KAG2111456.1 P-loop containing nucleoside triphosphate hydrolase protein [Suillus clintonianus]
MPAHAPSPNQDSSGRQQIPSFADIQSCTLEKFGIKPCLWQVKVAQALLKGDRDVICTAGTGMGTTLGFWLPLLFCDGGIQIIVTPLNMLGKQNAASLAKAGIRGISIDGKTATHANFLSITALKYRAIAVSPEQIMKPDGPFEKLLKNALFASWLISIIIDESHCLTDWGEFRPEYKELGRLRYILPSMVPIMLASATLTKHSLSNAIRLLHMHADKLTFIRRSTDRPNIKIGVRKIKYALNSYADLAFLIPEGWNAGDPPPPKFLIFFDDIQDAINSARYLRKRLPVECSNKIKWFNSDMTSTYKEKELDNLVSSETWGLCTTDSFGMGMDVPNIQLRFGRAARNKNQLGTASLFAEKEHFDNERHAKSIRKAQRENTRKRKAVDSPAMLHPAKRHAAILSDPGGPSISTVVTSHDGNNERLGDESDGDKSDDNEPDGNTLVAGSVQELKGAMASVEQARKNIGRPEKRKKR